MSKAVAAGFLYWYQYTAAFAQPRPEFPPRGGRAPGFPNIGGGSGDINYGALLIWIVAGVAIILLFMYLIRTYESTWEKIFPAIPGAVIGFFVAGVAVSIVHWLFDVDLPSTVVGAGALAGAVLALIISFRGSRRY